MVVSIYAKHQDYGISQQLVYQYYSLVEEGLRRVTDEIHAEFDELENDFQRVAYVMTLLKIPTSGQSLVDVLDVNYTKQILQLENNKNDYVSILFLKHGTESMKKQDIYLTLYDFTKAVFHAASKIQLALALAHRAEQLFSLGLIIDAKHDSKRALPNLELKTDKAKIRLILGKCYKYLNKIRKAKNQFRKVVRSLKNCEKPNEIQLRESALAEMALCAKRARRLETESPFNCYRPNLLKVEHPERNLQFYNTMTPARWTTVAARDLEAGEIVAVVKPFSNPLSANMTKYCFVCLNRCHSLIPCKNCANVGFCSDKCAKRARQDKMEGDYYPKRHKYDCNGVLPVIFNCFNKSKPSFFYRSLSHTVFNCIANTNPRRLIEYITATGKYKNGQSHAAFNGINEIRTFQPNLWLSSNYASVAWLHPGTDSWKDQKGQYGSMLFDFAIASIFLAYCLYIGGYPMDWYASRNIRPDTHRPSKAPAIWIAACFLYHFQATAINSFRCNEFVYWGNNKIREYLSCAIYPAVSLINHSCNPSADYCFTTDGTAVLIVTKSLAKGAELTITYNGTYFEEDTQSRRDLLKTSFFFKCMCEACKDEWNEVNPQELIKCPHCRFETALTTSKCPMCGINLRICEGLKVITDSQALVELMQCENWNDKLRRRFTFLSDRANSLLAPPSRTVAILTNALLDKMEEKVAMWTEEPWQWNLFTCMDFGKSMLSEDDRWDLLS
nr:SET and MYND domain containing protein 4 [Hymenolepis microstoma]